MELTLKIVGKNNNASYPIDTNVIITENFGETLDSMNLHLSHLSQPIEIEPYDFVQVVHKNGTTQNIRTWLVDSYVLKQDTMNSATTTYSYDISLFSETKGLEGIILPNLSITPLKIGEKRSIGHYVEQYVKQYSPKKRLKAGTREDFYYELDNVVFSAGGQDSIRTFVNAPELKGATIVHEHYGLMSGTDVSIISENYNVNTDNGTIEINIDYDNQTDYDFEGYLEIDVDYVPSGASKFVPKYQVASRLYARFNQIEAPELQWNTPTLREVLNDLLMIDDCIVVVKNDVIDYMDLTQTGKEIVDADINYTQRSKSSDDYVNEARMELQNVFQTQVDGTQTTTISDKWQPFTSDNVVITSEDIVFKTQFPILNVKHFYIGRIVPVVAKSAIHESVKGRCMFTWEDLCNVKGINDNKYSNFVYEYDEYRTKDLLYRTSYLGQDYKFEDYAKYQNFCVYYNRGQKNLKGFDNKTKDGFKGVDAWVETLSKLIWKAGNYINDGNLDEQGVEIDSSATEAVQNQYTTLFFKIEYETTANCVFQTSKDGENEGNIRVIQDNQTNSWVDAYSQGRLEQQKVNRMGNEVVMFNQRVDMNELNNIIKIGDKKGDVVVYQTQYQTYPDHIEVNAFGVKNFVLQNYFTGIKSKPRTWVNATNEAFIRHELDKRYCEFSFREKQEQSGDVVETYYLLDQFRNPQPSPIKHCAVQTYELSKAYYFNTISRVIGNSFTITAGLMNNAYIEYSIDTSKIVIITASPHPTIREESDYGGIPMQVNKYVDKNFESPIMFFNFCTGNSEVEFEKNKVLNPYDSQDRDKVENILKRYYAYPVITISEYTTNYKKFSSSFMDKDNKEIPMITKQYEFMSDTRDIYLTKQFVESEQAIRNIPFEYGIIVGSKANYHYGKQRVAESGRNVAFKPINISLANSSCAKMTIETNDVLTELTNNDVLYIVDNTTNKNVLLAINLKDYDFNGNNNKVEIYLTCKRLRTDKIINVDGSIETI